MKTLAKILVRTAAMLSCVSPCVNAQDPQKVDLVAVQAKLVEFMPHWIWKPAVAKGSSSPTFGGCRAKVSVVEPVLPKERVFWVEFTKSPEALAKEGLRFEVGATYSISLPSDFLSGDYGRISDWHVRGITKRPNKALEPTTTSVTSPAAQEPRQP